MTRLADLLMVAERSVGGLAGALSDASNAAATAHWDVAGPRLIEALTLVVRIEAAVEAASRAIEAQRRAA